MKRPTPLYLVTCWLCLGMLSTLGTIARTATRYQQTAGTLGPWVPLLFLVGFVLAAWLVWGFIRCRPLARWVCVFFFGYWTFSATWGVTRLLLTGRATRVGVCVLGVMWLAVFSINIASIAYLFTRRCREFALWYVREKDREGMQQYAQKQIERGQG